VPSSKTLGVMSLRAKESLSYTKTPKRIIYCVVTRLEMTKLKDIIYEVDENAFITINDVHDVFGGQFGKKSIH